MALEADLLTRIRSGLGDFDKTFRTTYLGDGATSYFDLPATNVGNVVLTEIVNGVSTVLINPDDYTLDVREGIITLVTPPAAGSVAGPNNVPPAVAATILVVEGTSTGLFSDAELSQYLDDSVLQHTHGSSTRVRYRDADGFIRYSERPVTLETLPPVEEKPLAILATVEALWDLSTDASTDVDISTADGTFFPRSQRYAQILRQIDILTDKYLDLCKQLNVGLHRIEMANLRRVSRTSGRYVPNYVDREWDDYSLPERIIPPIDSEHSERDLISTDDEVATQDFTIIAGDTFIREIDLGISLVGQTVLSGVRGFTSVYQGETMMTIVVEDAPNGIFTMKLTPFQTAHIGPSGQYDVQVTDDVTGDSTTWLRGKIWIDPQTTLSGTIPDGQIVSVNPWYIPGWTTQNQRVAP
jgi:hypothetical protein